MRLGVCVCASTISTDVVIVVVVAVDVFVFVFLVRPWLPDARASPLNSPLFDDSNTTHHSAVRSGRMRMAQARTAHAAAATVSFVKVHVRSMFATLCP